jgi:hypothetical protein
MECVAGSVWMNHGSFIKEVTFQLGISRKKGGGIQLEETVHAKAEN